MKVISILQPWASLVLMGAKKIETRSWNTKYRGPLLIHASKRKIKLQDGMYELIDEMTKIPGFIDNYCNLPYGSIIGQINLVTTAILCPPYKDHVSQFGIYINDKGAAFTDQELAFGDYSAGRYGWLLSDPSQFAKPIPAKGKLGLWDHELPL